MGSKQRIRPQSLGLEVAALLREALARREMTQAEVALRANVSSSQMSKFLRGVTPLSIDELDGICLAIGISFERLVVEAAYRTRARIQGREVDTLNTELDPVDEVRRVLTSPSRGDDGWWERGEH